MSDTVGEMARGSVKGSGAGPARRRRRDGVVTWRVSGLRQEIDEPDHAVLDRATRSIGVDPEAAVAARFARRSVDARGRGRDLHFLCQVDVVAPRASGGKKLDRLLRSGRVKEAPARVGFALEEPLGHALGSAPHVVVVGAGPGGLFAALAAAASGA
ncbi:MAG: hypothetical protein AAGB93_22060, partial [Planctomycetota bacterium]